MRCTCMHAAANELHDIPLALAACVHEEKIGEERRKLSEEKAERIAIIIMSAPLHEAVQQLSWLLGTWESEKAEGFFPTIKPFEYKETLEFTHVGQPLLNFSSFTPDNVPKHRDSGFMRVNVGTNHVAFLSSQNVGIVEIEEGDVNGTELCLESTGILHSSFASQPHTTKIARTFKLIDESTLEQSVSMATTTTPELKPHLSVRYKKV